LFKRNASHIQYNIVRPGAGNGKRRLSLNESSCMHYSFTPLRYTASVKIYTINNEDYYKIQL